MRRVLAGKMGQLSLALSQTVITKSNACLAYSSTDFDRWPEISIQISRIAAMASGRTELVFVPALEASNQVPPSCRSSPSAIWLRAEFPVHRIRTRMACRLSQVCRSGEVVRSLAPISPGLWAPDWAEKRGAESAERLLPIRLIRALPPADRSPPRRLRPSEFRKPPPPPQWPTRSCCSPL